MNENPAPPSTLNNLQDGENHYTPPQIFEENINMQTSLQIDQAAMVSSFVPPKDPVVIKSEYQSTANDSYYKEGQEEEKKRGEKCEKCIKCGKCFLKYTFCGIFILCIAIIALNDEDSDCCDCFKEPKKKKNEYGWDI